MGVLRHTDGSRAPKRAILDPQTGVFWPPGAYFGPPKKGVFEAYSQIKGPPKGSFWTPKRVILDPSGGVSDPQTGGRDPSKYGSEWGFRGPGTLFLMDFIGFWTLFLVVSIWILRGLDPVFIDFQ
jgi:hypothetical protein